MHFIDVQGTLIVNPSVNSLCLFKWIITLSFIRVVNLYSLKQGTPTVKITVIKWFVTEMTIEILSMALVVLVLVCLYWFPKMPAPHDLGAYQQQLSNQNGYTKQFFLQSQPNGTIPKRCAVLYLATCNDRIKGNLPSQLASCQPWEPSTVISSKAGGVPLI